MTDATFTLPAEVLEAIAQRAAEILRVDQADDGRAEWLTLDEAAGRYGATAAALRKRAERGRLPGVVKDEGRWLLHRPSYDAALLAKVEGTEHKWGERRANGPAPGTGGYDSHAR